MKKSELRNLIKEEIKKILKEGSIKDIEITFQEALESISLGDTEIDMVLNPKGSNYLIVKGMKLSNDQMKKVENAFNENSDDVQIHAYKIKGNNTIFSMLIGTTEY